MIAVARTLIARELLLAWRRRGDVAVALLFFVIVASLFPLGVGAEPNELRAIAPGVIWVSALLSSLLSLARLFAADHADGTLEQLILGAAPLGVIAAAKTAAHWIVSGLPLVVIAPLIALQYDVPVSLFGVLTLALVLGTPVLSFLGAIGAALTLGLRGGAAPARACAPAGRAPRASTRPRRAPRRAAHCRRGASRSRGSRAASARL